MKIEERSIYAIERRQFVGYEGELKLLTGESLPWSQFGMFPEPTCEQACASFDNSFPAALPAGAILWKDKPTAIRDLKGWQVHCTYAVTEDLRFTDAALLVPPEVKYPGKHKTVAMTTEEMLVRT